MMHNYESLQVLDCRKMCSQVVEKTVSKEVHQSSCETVPAGLHIHLLEELDRITKRMQSWSKVLPIEIVYFLKGKIFSHACFI